MNKIKEGMASKNWEFLSKNSNPLIINLFNKNIEYRFNINWDKMSGNAGVKTLDIFSSMLLYEFNLLNDDKIHNIIVSNNSDKLISIIRNLIIQYNYYDNHDFLSNLAMNKNIDIIFDEKYVDNDSKDNFLNIIDQLINSENFFTKMLYNLYTLKTINKSRLIPFEYLTNEHYLIQIVKNPLLFCSEKEFDERISLMN